MLSSSIPSEILLKIFKGLDYNSVLKVCTVNKRFSKVCEDRTFWIQYLKQLGYEESEELLKDKTLEELRTLVDYETASVDYVYSFYLNNRYELFATYVLGKDIVDEILDVIFNVRLRLEYFVWDLIEGTDLNSSQDLKDLSLIYMTHYRIDCCMLDDEDVNFKILDLIKINANPFRSYDSYFSNTVGGRSLAYVLIEECLLSETDLSSLKIFIDKFQPELDVSLLLLVCFIYDIDDKYTIMMNYILNSYKSEELSIIIHNYQDLSIMNRDHITDYLENGGFIVLKRQPSDEIIENQDLVFNRYRDQFIIEVDYFEPLF